MMVRPVGSWLDMTAGSSVWYALFWQWIFLSLAEIISMPVLRSLTGPEPEGNSQLLRPLVVLLGFLPLTLLLNATFAGLSWLFFRFIGLPRSFNDFLTWTAYGMLPLALGTLAGKLCLELMYPSSLPHSLLAPLEFRGISFGLSSWFPALLQPLEFAWLLFFFVDLFGIWSIALLCLGLRHFMRASRAESLLGSLCLLLLSFVLLTGIWQLVQRMAGPA